MANSNEETFTINVTGLKTGENYAGKFRVYRWLSFGQELQRDNLRRQLLGPAAGTPSDGVVNVADILSDLGVRIIEGPSWWMESQGGTTILDAEVVSELWKQVMAVPNKAMEELKKKAESAKTNVAAQNADVVA
jgi:hypothetical protein